MNNRISLWVQNASEGFPGLLFLHTSICIEFGGKKIIFSYNQDGLTYGSPVSDDY